MRGSLWISIVPLQATAAATQRGTKPALGAGAAATLTRQLQAPLFETSPLEPAVLAAVAALLAAICLLASWRATRVDPMAVLRIE